MVNKIIEIVWYQLIRFINKGANNVYWIHKIYKYSDNKVTFWYIIFINFIICILDIRLDRFNTRLHYLMVNKIIEIVWYQLIRFINKGANNV